MKTANIIDYLNMSQECDNPIEVITKPDYILDNYFKINKIERVSLINFLMINNFCSAFNSKPLVYEQITQYLADKFTLNKNNIILIGSARTGFAMDPTSYGRRFTEASDLDFAIIDKNLFDNSVKDFQLWKSRFENNEYLESQKNKYWPDNRTNLKHQINRGFIDTYKIPSYPEFTNTQPLKQSLSLIVKNLSIYQKIVVKEASARIYINWETFQKQLRLNTEHVLQKVPQNRITQ